jgi:hypothetical protein
MSTKFTNKNDFIIQEYFYIYMYTYMYVYTNYTMEVLHDSNEHIIISPLDIFEYFANTKRPIREGTELLNAGWVTAIGIAPFPVENRIIGLVVQTSSISARPHEVKMDFLKKTYEYWKCVCSCKAGIGEKCKHIAACLLHINR